MDILHATASNTDPVMLVVLALAGLGSAVVVGIAVAAFLRRRSRSYLLVLLALATILVRTAVPGLQFAGFVSAAEHHLVEHALDVAMASLVIAAVVYVRSSGPDVDAEGQEALDD